MNNPGFDVDCNFSRYVSVLCLSFLIIGCSQDMPALEPDTNEAGSTLNLENTSWRVLSIDGVDILEQRAPNLSLKEDGQLAGSTGCNNFFGSWSAADAVASFDAAGISLRACEPELMEQERAFLEALRIISAAETSPEGTLSLLDESSTVRLLLAPLDQATTKADAAEPLDLAATTSHRFSCGDAGAVEFRFLGPDTIEVTAGIDRYVMQHQQAASGARYAGEGAEFWNKGDEALFTVGEQRFECKRVAD